MMKKALLLLLLFPGMAVLAHANTKTPAANVTVDTSTFHQNLNSTDDTVQKALVTLDTTAGGGGGNPGGSNNSIQYNNNGVFAGGLMYYVAGNVGIGSPNPTAALDVVGGIKTQGFTLNVGSSLNGKVLLSDANGNGTWQNIPSGSGTVNPGFMNQFAYYATDGTAVNSQPSLYFDSASGNIAIGSTSADQALQVNGAVHASSFIGPGILSGLTANKIPKASNATTLVDSLINEISGNIGIGSSTPGQALDVQGTIRGTNLTVGTLTGILKAAFGNVTTATSGTDYAPATSGTSILKGNNAGGFANAVGGVDYQTPLTFSTGLTNGAGTVVVNTSQSINQLSNLSTNGVVTTTGGTGNLVVVSPGSLGVGLWTQGPVGINTTSNVGIGSTTPIQALDVNGTIRTTSMVTTGNVGVGTSTALNQTLTVQGNIALQGGASPSYITGSNFGIGSTNPGQAIDIQGTLRTTGFILSTGAVSGYILETNSVGVGTWVTAPTSGGTPGGSASQLQFNNSGVFGGVSGSGVAGNNVGIGSVNPEYGLVVGANGVKVVGSNPSSFSTNVGINSTNPGQWLDIQGTARMLGFQMNVGSSLNGKVLTSDANGNGSWSAAGGSGTVTTVSVVTANGISGSVANATTTPAITLTPFLTSAGINWQDVNLFKTISGGINWQDLRQVVQNVNINWPDINSGASIGKGAVNWNDISGFIPGAVLTAIDTNSANWNNTILIKSGNVGVGSAAPGQKFDVNGTVRATNFSGAGTSLTGTASSLSIGGNAATSTALASTPTGCSSNLFANSIDASGNLGCGAPFSLTTTGTSGAATFSAGTLNIPNYTTGGGSNFWVAGTGGTIGIGTTANVAIGTLSGTGALIVSGGNVGIGTLTAGSPLTVGTGLTVSSTGALVASSAAIGGSGTYGGTLGVEGLAASNNGFTNGQLNGYFGGGNYTFNCNMNGTLGGQNGCNIVGASSSGTTNNIKISSANSTGGTWNITGGNNGAKKIATFQDDGNVGIGTNVPAYPFAIVAANIGISTTSPAELSTTFNGKGATSCVCTQFKAGLCVSGSCT